MKPQLAINGGAKSVTLEILPSPQSTSLDEEFVLKSLRSGAHAWGENCEALQREWAAWNGNRNCMATTSGTDAHEPGIRKLVPTSACRATVRIPPNSCRSRRRVHLRRLPREPCGPWLPQPGKRSRSERQTNLRTVPRNVRPAAATPVA